MRSHRHLSPDPSEYEYESETLGEAGLAEPGGGGGGESTPGGVGGGDGSHQRSPL